MIKRQTTFTIIVNYDMEDDFSEQEEFAKAIHTLFVDAENRTLFIDDFYSTDSIL